MHICIDISHVRAGLQSCHVTVKGNKHHTLRAAQARVLTSGSETERKLTRFGTRPKSMVVARMWATMCFPTSFLWTFHDLDP